MALAERYNKTSMYRVRCLISEAKIIKWYWHECIYTAVYLGNRLLTNTNIIKKNTICYICRQETNCLKSQNIYKYNFLRIPEECRAYSLDAQTWKLNYNTSFDNIMGAYVDTDWAADIDRKSTTGILIIRVFGNALMWKSQTQKVVSRASTHGEYDTLA
ncbi:hypothetical protein PR048_021055, partial [Dryococelus australis]